MEVLDNGFEDEEFENEEDVDYVEEDDFSENSFP